MEGSRTTPSVQQHPQPPPILNSHTGAGDGGDGPDLSRPLQSSVKGSSRTNGTLGQTSQGQVMVAAGSRVERAPEVKDKQPAISSQEPLESGPEVGQQDQEGQS